MRTLRTGGYRADKPFAVIDFSDLADCVGNLYSLVLTPVLWHNIYLFYVALVADDLIHRKPRVGFVGIETLAFFEVRSVVHV